MKTCNKCKVEKEDSEFNNNSKKKDGLQARCRECNKSNLKKHYLSNLKKYKTKNDNRRKSTRDYINSKKTQCQRCGESHIACLDFHHKGDKEINIAVIPSFMWSTDRIDIELAKCEILCANCHRKLHYEERHSTIV